MVLLWAGPGESGVVAFLQWDFILDFDFMLWLVIVYTESVSLSLSLVWDAFLDVALCVGLDLCDSFFGRDLDFLFGLEIVSLSLAWAVCLDVALCVGLDLSDSFFG